MPASRIKSSNLNETICKDLINFINRSPSPYHVVYESKQLLENHGFQYVSERQNQWELLPNHKYYTIRNDSAVIAFAIGGKYQKGNPCTILGAHTDSPCLKIKPKSKIQSNGWLQLGVECYGGGLFHTWFDRDLSIAGKVYVKENECSSVSVKYNGNLIQIPEPILRVPTLAIHLGREQGNEFKYNKEDHLRPILATAIKGMLEVEKKENENPNPTNEKLDKSRMHPILLEYIANQLNCTKEDIIDFDLYLYDTQPGAIGGLQKEFIYSPRLDNLCSTYVSLQALINSLSTLVEDSNVRMVAFFDNEEVGSSSYMGAGSNFLQSTIQRISEDHTRSCIARSILLSIDMAHAVHPNYADRHEINHKPMLHLGPVIKYHSGQRYATTADTSALLKSIAVQHKVPLQEFMIKQDLVCGSTIGPIMSTRLGIRTIDIGIGQLSMHSIREMCGTDDVVYLGQLLEAVLNDYSKYESEPTPVNLNTN